MNERITAQAHIDYIVCTIEKPGISLERFVVEHEDLEEYLTSNNLLQTSYFTLEGYVKENITISDYLEFIINLTNQDLGTVVKGYLDNKKICKEIKEYKEQLEEIKAAKIY